MTAPKRQWFAFSLRTLFVVVTVSACWLGYQLNWIKERHSLIGAPQQTGVEPEYGIALMPMSLLASLQVESKDAPWPLRWLGERGVCTLYIRDNMSESEVARIRALFPEAEIDRVSKDYFDGDESQ